MLSLDLLRMISSLFGLSVSRDGYRLWSMDTFENFDFPCNCDMVNHSQAIGNALRSSLYTYIHWSNRTCYHLFIILFSIIYSCLMASVFYAFSNKVLFNGEWEMLPLYVRPACLISVRGGERPWWPIKEAWCFRKVASMVEIDVLRSQVWECIYGNYIFIPIKCDRWKSVREGWKGGIWEMNPMRRVMRRVMSFQGARRWETSVRNGIQVKKVEKRECEKVEWLVIYS